MIQWFSNFHMPKGHSGLCYKADSQTPSLEILIQYGWVGGGEWSLHIYSFNPRKWFGLFQQWIIDGFSETNSLSILQFQHEEGWLQWQRTLFFCIGQLSVWPSKTQDILWRKGRKNTNDYSSNGSNREECSQHVQSNSVSRGWQKGILDQRCNAKEKFYRSLMYSYLIS